MPEKNKSKIERMAENAGALATISEVCDYLGINQSTRHRWIEKGRFPKADVAVGTKYRRYRWKTIKDWEAAGGAC